MNVSEITDERLNNLATNNAIVPAMLVEVAALAKAEQERRRAAKEEKVEPVVRYWTHKYHNYLDIVAKTVDDKMVECYHKTGGEMVVEDVMIAGCWQAIPQAEYESAKPKPASVVSPCLDCGTTHEGSCTNTSEAKNKPETRSCENCGNGPIHSVACCARACNVRHADNRYYFNNWIPKPKPVVGDGAIAKLERLGDVGRFFLKINELVDKHNEIIDAVNRMREGK